MSLGTLTARVALDTSPLSAGVKAAAMGFGLVAAGAAAAIYKVGSAYQDSLNTFQAVSSASAAQMRQVGDEAKKLGADMQLPATSAADAAKAMTELAKSGLSVEESMAAAKGTLQLAAAAQVDEAKAAEISANALNAFGLKGTEAGRVADILAASANASSAEITDMADALKMSSAVAAAAHIPIEDLAAALGELANKGIKGSDAGTSVKQMLLSLEGPSKKAAGVMREYGIDIYTADGRMKSFRDIIANVSGALGGLNDEQRNAALATIFGSDAVRAANIVLLGGVDAFDQMKAAVTKNGAAADVAAAKTKGLKGAIEGLKSQLEGVAITLYEKAAPGVERFVRSLADGVPKAVAAIKSAFDAIAGGFQNPDASIGSSVDGVEAAFLRIGAAARQVVDWFRENWPGIKATIADVIDWIRTDVVPKVQEVAAFFVEQFSNVVDWVDTNWPRISEAVGHVITAMQKLAPVVRMVWEDMKGQIETAIEIIKAVISTGLDIINGEWGAIWDRIKDGLASVWDAMVQTVRDGMATLVDFFLGGVERILQGAATAFSWVPGVGPKLRDAAEKFERFRDETNEALRGVTRDPIVVQVDTREARASIAQLRDELATLNSNIAQSGPGGGNRAAANQVEADIAEQESAGSAGYTDNERPPDAANASGGVIRRAAAGLGMAGRRWSRLGQGGGRPHGPTLVSEAGYDEWVITPDPMYRLRNLGLLSQASQALGVSSGGRAPSAPIDYQALAAALSPVLVAAVAGVTLRPVISTFELARGLHQARPR